jgi:superfamily II DNA or RNA helicase
MQHAPVPGSHVWLRQRRWRVDRTRIDRHSVRFDVSQRATRLTVLTPYDHPRLIARPRRTCRVRRQQGLARLAHLLGARPSARMIHAALDANIRLWPHQLEPALAALDGRRRLLIADEVGLGKTIEAGLILAEAIRRDPATCALVIAPAGLRPQWADELRTRFSIEASTTDDGLDDAVAGSRSGASPWRRPGVWLVSIDYMKQRHVIDGLPAVAWDVVVIDEAHTATGRSDRHDVCDELGRRARCLVLLSATPHDGDATRFARLLRLGSLPFADDTLTIFRRTRADISLPHPRVVRWTRTRLTPEFARLLDALEAFERLVLQGVRPASRDAALLLLAVFRKRALSTAAALDRSLAKRLEWLDTPAGAGRPDWTQVCLDFEADDLDNEDRASLVVDVGLERARERAWLTRLRALAAAAMGCEQKLRRLQACAARSAEPLVIFTEFRHSLEVVQSLLVPLRSVAVIHGGQPDAVRRRELARFLSGDATVLVATDVGSHGLNLQHRARWLITLELPWNPTRLEQRIGRLDRIGQTRRVHATLLVTDHGSEATLLASIARRTLAARRTLGAATLADVAPPPHLAMAAAVLAGRALPDVPPSHSPADVCTMYSRRARAHVRVIGRRRTLIGLWRGGPASTGRPVRVALALCGLPPHVRALVVLSASLIDRAGMEVEQRIVAVSTRESLHTSLSSAPVFAHAQALLSANVQRRLRRLRHERAVVAGRRVRVEQAIAMHLHAIGHPQEAQLGLFSQREAAAFGAAQARAAFAASSVARRLQREEDRAVLDASLPSIEWIGERR